MLKIKSVLTQILIDRFGLKVARTIADLEGSIAVRQHHIMEAIGLEKIEAGLVLRH
ncbi:MAG: hypothetical protein IJM66_12195 [Muribaculaceae bacterium]|nr:hypothetical protein [Muribaculaceae bacterium]MBQ6649595.1 hypothetical protein [Muribaculaceae bacterium]